MSSVRQGTHFLFSLDINISVYETVTNCGVKNMVKVPLSLYMSRESKNTLVSSMYDSRQSQNFQDWGLYWNGVDTQYSHYRGVGLSNAASCRRKSGSSAGLL